MLSFSLKFKVSCPINYSLQAFHGNAFGSNVGSGLLTQMVEYRSVEDSVEDELLLVLDEDDMSLTLLNETISESAIVSLLTEKSHVC